MNGLDLIAVALVCATAFGIAWVLGERWYVHRDRAYARLVASTEVSTALAIADVKKAADEAVARLDAHVAGDRAQREAVAARVTKLEKDDQERGYANAFGGKR
jgi:hypothetical protein